jgi:hypothetical protein
MQRENEGCVGLARSTIQSPSQIVHAPTRLPPASQPVASLGRSCNLREVEP